MPTEIDKFDFRASVYHQLRKLGYTGTEAKAIVDKLKELMEEQDAK